MKIKNNVPVNKDEIHLVKFIGRYQYLDSKDTQYFFNNTYSSKRITKLIKNNILRRYKGYLVISKDGKNFLKSLGQSIVPLRYQKKYVDRLKFISHIAAFYNKNKFITFIPSFEMKNKEVFTETSRKYIGILNIDGTKYLLYHISEKNTQKYINSVVYDLQKEKKHKNIIVLINDIQRINLKDFCFGLNSVIICEDTDEILLKLASLQRINWPKLIHKLYNGQIYLSKYNFCDYTDNRNKYVSMFYFIDTEKINRINTFLRNNIDRQVNIVCDKDIYQFLKKENSKANYQIINLEDFLEKEIRIYEEDNF